MTTDYPVPNYPVIITTFDSADFRVTITDQDGYYLDSIYNHPAGIDSGVAVSVVACQGTFQTIFFYEPDTFNIANFEVCPFIDSCQAMFAYEPDFEDPFLIHFTNLSMGNYEETSLELWRWKLCL